MKLKKIIMLILLLIFMLCTLTSCFGYTQKARIGATICCYAIPGGYHTDPHASRVKIIEKDPYGRMALQVHLGMIDAICIVQKASREELYYYDNICYECTDSYSEYDETVLARIKEKNDWGEPPDLSKCTKKPLNTKRDLYPLVGHLCFEQLDNIKTYIAETYDSEFSKYDTFVQISDNCRIDVTNCDKSVNGLELYLLSVQVLSKDNKYEGIEHYLVIVNQDGSYDPDNYVIQFDHLNKSNEPLIEIKERNGWVPTT